ncbi:MAG: hypothetical protein AAF658_12625, partial [Myxococcota bacterium]
MRTFALSLLALSIASCATTSQKPSRIPAVDIRPVKLTPTLFTAEPLTVYVAPSVPDTLVL